MSTLRSLVVAVPLAFIAGVFTGNPHVFTLRGAAVSSHTAGHANESASLSPSTEKAKSEAATARKALEELSRQPACEARDEARYALIMKWAEREPITALAYVEKELVGDKKAWAFASIISLWGKNAPQQAWEWLKTNMPEATYHFDNLLEVFGNFHPDLVAQYVAEYSAQYPAAATEVYLSSLIGLAHAGNFARAKQLAERATLDPDSRASLVNCVAGQWARHAPAEAAAWVMTLPEGELRNRALIGLGESWSDVDQPAAATFAASLPPGEPRQLALQQAMGKWVLSDPVKAGEWLVKNPPHPDFDRAVSTIATSRELMDHHTSIALDWAASIYDEKLRTDSLSIVLANWSVRDPQAAAAYVKNAPGLSNEIRAELTKRFAGDQTH